MQLDARITRLEFSPGDYLRIYGHAWSPGYDESRISTDGYNKFNQAWFWYSDFQPDVENVLTQVVRKITTDLANRKIIPKLWPGKLAEGNTNDGVFTYILQDFILYDQNWDSSKCSTVGVHMQSDLHNNGVGYTSEFRVKLTEKTNNKLFTTLDKYL